MKHFLSFLILSLLLIISFLPLQIFAENSDLLYVEISGDVVKIWNNAQLNCCSLYKFETEITEGKIKLIEIDTSTSWCRCICNFNLCASIVGLQAGNYKVEVFRNLPVSFPPDSLFFVGSLEFNYSPGLYLNSYQSDCISFINSSQSTENNSIAQDDSLFVEFSYDTVKIWNTNVLDQCCAKFKIEFEISNALIKLTETDTSNMMCNCICKFNLCGILVGLKPGQYRIEIYRSDSYIGSIEFYYPPWVNIPSLSKSSQSGCLGTSPDGNIIYLNSFESPEDTAGWSGYMQFHNEVPPNGGNQSALISGGCVVPHAWKVFGPFNKDALFKLGCWGKDIGIGGFVSIELEDEIQNQINITIDKKEWAYYESADSLYCPAGKRIILSMSSGGIVASAMLIDLLEIVNINEVTGGLDNKENISTLSFGLYQNYPNPFNPTTTITYAIPLLGGDERGGLVTLKVYDVLGREVARLVNEDKEAGYHSIDFDGVDLPSGVYFYQLRTGPSSSSGQVFIDTKKMLLLK